ALVPVGTVNDLVQHHIGGTAHDSGKHTGEHEAGIVTSGPIRSAPAQIARRLGIDRGEFGGSGVLVFGVMILHHLGVRGGVLHGPVDAANRGGHGAAPSVSPACLVSSLSPVTGKGKLGCGPGKLESGGVSLGSLDLGSLD